MKGEKDVSEKKADAVHDIHRRDPSGSARSFCYQYFSKVLLNNVQQRELQNNNQIIYSLDDFFNSLSKISDSLLMNEELTRILQNTYQGSEARLQNYRDKSQVEELLYRNGYYLDNRIETIAIFPENSDMFYYCTKKTINPAYVLERKNGTAVF